MVVKKWILHNYILYCLQVLQYVDIKYLQNFCQLSTIVTINA